MNIVSALEAKNQFGHLLDTAQAHPVQISKHGRPVAYIISTMEYDRLQKLQSFNLENAVLQANQEEMMDEDYQKELSVWDTTISDGIAKKYPKKNPKKLKK